MTLEALENLPQLSIFTKTFADILADNIASYQTLDPTWSALRTDPVYKALQTATYAEFITRLTFGARLREILPPYMRGAAIDRALAIRGLPARGTDEDDIAALRRLISPPSRAPVGTIASIKRFAFDADMRVQDVGVVVANNGQSAAVYLLSDEADNGMPTADLNTVVGDYLDATDRSHLTDSYTVTAPTITDYAVTVDVKYDEDAIDAAVLQTAAEEALAAYALSRRRLGLSIRQDGIKAALKRIDGVEYTEITAPNADLVPTNESIAYYATPITVTVSTA